MEFPGRYIISVWLIIISCLLASAEGPVGEGGPGADGPYIFYNEDGSARMVSIASSGRMSDTVFVSGLPEGFRVKVEDRSGKYAFEVPVVEKSRPEWNYRQARKTFIMSDIHGKMEVAVELLKRKHFSSGLKCLIVQ
ncbi:MAG: hypothetical protein ACI3ZC_06655 [Candidatus Cryptobacteroides sp.]